jgi:2-hydroxychromene-2-carboxylate isomerase
MKPVDTGITTIMEIVPRADDTAASAGNPGIDVVSTIALILYIETACEQLLAPYYEPGEATVGTRVEVDHLAPAKIEQPVHVSATLEQIRSRRFIFATEIRQGDRPIMSGFHHRNAVRMDDYSNARPQSRRRHPVLDFWFDFHSPWCYLASTRIGAIAREHGATLRWRPVHLANLLDRIDGRRPLEGTESFVSWYRQDLADQVAELRLPYRRHPDYPLRPSRALRAALLAGDEGRAEAFVREVMRAYWVDARDISDLEVLGALGAAAGLDPKAVQAAATDDPFKQRLQSNLTEAIKADIFGVPTVTLDKKRYFGNDHLDLLAKHLNFWTPKD